MDYLLSGMVVFWEMVDLAYYSSPDSGSMMGTTDVICLHVQLTFLNGNRPSTRIWTYSGYSIHGRRGSLR